MGRVSFGKTGKVLEMDSHGGHTTPGMSSMSPNCMLRNGQNGTLYVM